MQSEIRVLRALWERARTDGARARLLASFTEADRRQLYGLTGDAALVEGFEENLAGSIEYTLEPESKVCGGLELIWPGPLECRSFEQRVEKARRRQDKRLVKKLAKAWRKRQAESLRTGLELARWQAN